MDFILLPLIINCLNNKVLYTLRNWYLQLKFFQVLQICSCKKAFPNILIFFNNYNNTWYCLFKKANIRDRSAKIRITGTFHFKNQGSETLILDIARTAFVWKMQRCRFKNKLHPNLSIWALGASNDTKGFDSATLFKSGSGKRIEKSIWTLKKWPYTELYSNLRNPPLLLSAA